MKYSAYVDTKGKCLNVVYLLNLFFSVFHCALFNKNKMLLIDFRHRLYRPWLLETAIHSVKHRAEERQHLESLGFSIDELDMV